jgi:hypothetical protein
LFTSTKGAISRGYSTVRGAKPPPENRRVDDANKESEDPEVLQRQFDAMIEKGSAATNFDNMPTTANKENEDNDLYNPIPLFTGAVLTTFSLMVTGYLFYAGLTCNDPLAGHHHGD